MTTLAWLENEPIDESETESAVEPTAGSATQYQRPCEAIDAWLRLSDPPEPSWPVPRPEPDVVRSQHSSSRPGDNRLSRPGYQDSLRPIIQALVEVLQGVDAAELKRALGLIATKLSSDPEDGLFARLVLARVRDAMGVLPDSDDPPAADPADSFGAVDGPDHGPSDASADEDDDDDLLRPPEDDSREVVVDWLALNRKQAVTPVEHVDEAGEPIARLSRLNVTGSAIEESDEEEPLIE